MKQKKFFIIFFIIFLNIFTLLLLQGTQAKYRKKIEGQGQLNIASWNIKINSETILNKEQLTKKIEPKFFNNENIKDNVLAPGAKGYFDIELDPTESDVSFQYKIIATVSEDSTIKDFITTGYEINPKEIPNPEPYDSSIGIIGELEHNSQIQKIRVYIEWNDNTEEETMNNQEDTEAATTENAKAIMNVIFNFTQKK